MAKQAVGVAPEDDFAPTRGIPPGRQRLVDARGRGAGRRHGRQRPGAHGQTSVSPECFSGNVRTGLPVAAKIAFSTDGAVTQIVGSPTPPQKS